jgi:hypothetical protein
MPKEKKLPRREVEKAKPEFEKTKKVVEQLNIHNSKPPAGDPKPFKLLDQSVLGTVSARLYTAEAQLQETRPRMYIVGFTESAKQWREKTKAFGGDLGGYWNDFRNETGVRAVTSGLEPQERARIYSALNMLELADRDGGLTAWLQRFGAEMGADKSSWEELADAAEGIQRSIKFAVEILDQTLGQEKLSDPARNLRNELALALDAVGAEVSRRITEFKKQGNYKGHELAAVSARLKAESAAGVEDRLREAFVEKHKLKQAFVAELPASLQDDAEVQVAGSKVDGWHVEALDLGRIAAGGPNRNPQADLDAANRLNLAADALGGKLAEIAKWKGDSSHDILGLDPTRLQRTRAAAIGLADCVRKEQKRLADQLVSPDAKKLLLTGTGVAKIEAALDGLRWAEKISSGNTISDTVKADFDAIRQHIVLELGGRLWQAPYNFVESKLADPTINRDTSLHKAFTLGFGQCGLSELLDRWNARKPDETYELAWLMLARLREFKATASEAFRKAPDFADFLNATFDAIAVEVGTDVDTQMKSTT